MSKLDVKKLSTAVCEKHGWDLKEVRFYTGLHKKENNPFWHDYWTKRFLQMKRQQVYVKHLPLKYIEKSGKIQAQEKGIDVRIALDIVRLSRQGELDVVLLFSQDQDLSQVAEEIRLISNETGRYIKIASAYPVGAKASSPRGIDKTDWIKMDKSFYEACLDLHDYRPRKS